MRPREPNQYLPLVGPPCLLVWPPGFEQASSEPSVGVLSLKCPATMSWSCAPRGSPPHVRAACTRWPEWIRPCWWFTTLRKATAGPQGARRKSSLCLAGRGTTSRLGTRRSPERAVSPEGSRTEEPWLLSLSSVEGSSCEIGPSQLGSQTQTTVYKTCTRVWLNCSSGFLLFFEPGWIKEQAVKAVPELWLPDKLICLIKACIRGDSVWEKWWNKAAVPGLRLLSSPVRSPGDDYLGISRSPHEADDGRPELTLEFEYFWHIAVVLCVLG